MYARVGKHKKLGVNLVEVVLASFILVSAMIALTVVFTTHYRALNQSRAHLVAVHLGQKIMEECLSQGFSGIDGYAVPYAPALNNIVTMQSKVGDRVVSTDYNVAVEVNLNTIPVTPLPAGGNPIKDVVVTVKWSEGALTHKIRYESLITDGG